MNHYWTITTTFLLLSAYLHFLSKSFHMLCLCPLLHDYWYQQRSPWILSEACLKSKSIKFLNSVHLYVFTTSVQFPVIFLCILDDNIMFMKTTRGFFFFRAWNQEHSNIILYLLLHFVLSFLPKYCLPGKTVLFKANSVFNFHDLFNHTDDKNSQEDRDRS